jgi:hypothetical protein
MFPRLQLILFILHLKFYVIVTTEILIFLGMFPRPQLIFFILYLKFYIIISTEILIFLFKTFTYLSISSNIRIKNE